MKLKTVDLFAGGGGLSLGFSNAGFNIVAAFDNWDPAINLYKQNISGHPIVKCDLLSEKSIEGIMQYSPDIIIGGPPCQDFSSAGKRDESLGRADLTISFANIINEIRPSFFVMENVARSFQSKTFARAKEIFKKAGYGLNIRILDASLCGVPQQRKRLFVIGERGGKDEFLESLIDERLSDEPMTLREYFGDKLGIEHYYRHPRSYARRAIFSIDEPSPTIRGVNRPVPSGYPGHIGDSCNVNQKVRPLTSRERSMIQTFPESYILTGSKTELEQIIGNAVPVKLAEFVASCLKKYITLKGMTGKPDKASQVVEFPVTPKFQQRMATLNSLRKRIKCA
ncbi:MAG: DNA (cytosine-5-)-methyltransferase [Victivallales bacterium]|jgi:DNA (cytosine-5)-methyltransferase 1